jgi:hypothetical protein
VASRILALARCEEDERDALQGVAVDCQRDGHRGEGGYGGTPGTSGKGGAYFTTDPALALGLAPKKDYRNGVLVMELEQTDYDALCAAGDVLPDPYLPLTSVRVQPTGFSAFNRATSPPGGTRSYFPPGSQLPGGQQTSP